MGSKGETVMGDVPKGRPLAIDATAKSDPLTEPAFISLPEGAPVYYGFVVLDDVTAEGFTLGKITDFEAEPCDEGDAFVIAPDGSRSVWFGKSAIHRTSERSCPSKLAGGVCGVSASAYRSTVVRVPAEISNQFCLN
jgi:hypothetical protein